MKIYADHAATTKMSDAAVNTLLCMSKEVWGNPSSLYEHGQKAKEVLEQAREDVASVINADPKEIYFTSGGSEADNQAILTAAEIGRKQGKKHIISSAFEHHAVLHTLEKLRKEGFEKKGLTSRCWTSTRTASSSPVKWRMPSGTIPVW